MNRKDPWDWSTPFQGNLPQPLGAQVAPLGNQNNMQAPPSIPGQPNMVSQAVQNRVVSRGLNEVLPEKATAAIPNKAPVFDAVPVPVEQIAVPVVEAAPLGNGLAAAGGGGELLAAGAEAQALLEAQMAAAAAAESGGLMAMLSSAAAAA